MHNYKNSTFFRNFNGFCIINKNFKLRLLLFCTIVICYAYIQMNVCALFSSLISLELDVKVESITYHRKLPYIDHILDKYEYT